ncbi:MAG: glycosyltransferase family 4 protein [Actinomycetota bacterium]|nr:glycosyltransferase family 4 protein [Actinomycetota bacterium]
MEEIKEILRDKSQSLNTIFISSYVPRKCGIATYTRDLVHAIELINPYCKLDIIAMVKPGERIKYPSEVKLKINQDDINSYIKAARNINKSAADIVVIQHEFGLYGGEFGRYMNELVKLLEKPVVLTVHTVPDDPDAGYGLVLKDLIRYVDRIIVMMPGIRGKLANEYEYPLDKIEVIPHGVPDIPLEPGSRYKNKSGFRSKLVLGSINLLSENKGIEYVIEALPEIKEHVPGVLYLIIGQTHPNVLKYEGEKYRNFLQEKVKQLNLDENVRFINKYLQLRELISWLMTIDIYITPYLDPKQTASGALAYAIGAGKVCISTPYLYAKEILSEGRGIIVPFRDPHAIAEAVIDIYKNPQKRAEIEKKAYKYGRLMTWYNVAEQHLRLFSEVIDEYKDKETKDLVKPVL